MLQKLLSNHFGIKTFNIGILSLVKDKIKTQDTVFESSMIKRSIRQWIKAFKEKGVDGLIAKKRPGRTSIVFKNVGFGLGFDHLKVEVEAHEDTDIPLVNFNGAMDLNYTGIMIYTKIYF